MSHKMPSSSEIRDRIDSIGRDFNVADLKGVPRYADDEQYRRTFQYLLLVAGRVSEGCGQYMPTGDEAFQVDFELGENKVPAALFAVKTAKRKTNRGWTLRPAAIPLHPLYEPWAKELLDYVQSYGDDYPFKLGPKTKTSIRYAQRVAETVFEGLMWPMEGYNRTRYEPASENQIIEEREKNGVTQYLIEFDDGSRKWCNDRNAIPKSIAVLDRWKKASIHTLRKRRNIDLEWFYKFNDKDLNTFSGWEEKGSQSHAATASKFYLHLDLTEAKQNLHYLKVMAENYIPKLLRPLDELMKLGI